MKKIEGFLLWLSVTDTDYLEKCPKRERIIQTIYGSTILTTTIFAGLTAGYAIFIIFNNYFISFLCGLVWAFAVSNFDRLLISSFKTSSRATSESFILKKIFYPIVFRLPFAILIGFTVAVPIETLLFKGQIDYNYEKEKVNNSVANSSIQSDFLKNKLNAKYKEDSIKLRLGEYLLERDSLNRIINDLNKDIAKFQQERVTISNKTTNYNDSTSSTVENQRTIASQAFQNAQNEHNKLTKKIETINDSIFVKRRIIENSLKNFSEEIENSDSYKMAGSLYKPNDLIEQINILEKISQYEDEDSRILFYIKWAIRLLIIFIEAMPILLKVIADQTIHDIYVDAYFRYKNKRLTS